MSLFVFYCFSDYWTAITKPWTYIKWDLEYQWDIHQIFHSTFNINTSSIFHYCSINIKIIIANYQPFSLIPITPWQDCGNIRGKSFNCTSSTAPGLHDRASSLTSNIGKLPGSELLCVPMAIMILKEADPPLVLTKVNTSLLFVSLGTTHHLDLLISRYTIPLRTGASIVISHYYLYIKKNITTSVPIIFNISQKNVIILISV